METRARSIVKAATWRIGGLAATVAVVWIVTGRVGLAATIGVADTAVKLFAYYVHERVWARIRFGRPRSPEYEI